jgi:hypothetical protein
MTRVVMLVCIFRLYAPSQPAIEGSWKPGDFEPMK